MKVSVRDEKDLIHNALELLDSGKHWIKYTSRDGDSFCIAGAIGEAGIELGDNGSKLSIRRKAFMRIQESIQRLFPRRALSIPVFNDSASTTWKDVEAVLRDAMK